MTWPSHILAGVALAKGFNLSLPLTVAGSLAPDLAEMLVGRFVCNYWKGLSYAAHRTWTHSVFFASLFLLASWNIPPVRDFFIGVLFGHLFLDAMTTMGVPILDGRKRRITVFGGKLHTWSLGEFVTALITAFVFYAVIPSLTVTKNWDGLYTAGIIDKYEYEQRKSALFGFLKKEPPAEEPLPHLPWEGNK